jgi:hypothetical protein
MQQLVLAKKYLNLLAPRAKNSNSPSVSVVTLTRSVGELLHQHTSPAAASTQKTSVAASRQEKEKGKRSPRTPTIPMATNGSMDKGRTEMEVGEDGVAVVTVVNPPVNALSIQGISSSAGSSKLLLSFPFFI